jgi:hypothetical protein
MRVQTWKKIISARQEQLHITVTVFMIMTRKNRSRRFCIGDFRSGGIISPTPELAVALPVDH